MTLLLLVVWNITGSSPTLAEPWSTWFVLLFIAAWIDFG